MSVPMFEIANAVIKYRDEPSKNAVFSVTKISKINENLFEVEGIIWRFASGYKREYIVSVSGNNELSVEEY